ncbi:energy-coupling factor transporter transmembrane component T [Ruminococcus sp.]|uniref:energy-coupling factor transporter transmembrane component T n=1 Tax=Ruminococcus sp. TaxID=41978 RepID=UPI0025D6AB70|nr:energy-coupling factor transporter transmembrane component T [Ruminococcus sp.]MBQ8965566.1 hypothetical protein [Ruminococcus sp.]
MKPLHPVCRLTAVMTVLICLMFSRSITAVGAGLLGGLVCLGLLCGAKSLFKALFGSLAFSAAVSVIDPLFSHRGMTVLLFVNDRPYTAESMLYGLMLGLSLSGATLWLTLCRRLLTDREILCIFGRISPKLAMTVSMTLGFIPRLIEKQKRIRSAQQWAGLFAGSSPTDRLQSSAAVFMACVAWSAEAAAGAARSMDSRGYGTHSVTYSDSRRLRRADLVFLTVQTGFTAAAVIFMALGGNTDFYPTIVFGRYEPLLTAAVTALCLPAIIFLAKEDIQWKLYTSKR